MPKTSKITLYVALAANIGIALSKFVTAFIGHSSVMLAEGIHSTVDCSTELLLMLGIKRSKKPSDQDHPFGYGKEVYFWTLVVSIITFALGSGMAIYEGISQIRFPEPLKNSLLNYMVLFISFCFEGTSFLVAASKFPRRRRGKGFWEEVRLSKDPSLFAIIYEDGAALIGLLIAFAGVLLSNLFQRPIFDGLASIAVGILLAGVSYIMVRESRNLLVGESAQTEMVREIFDLVNTDENVYTLTHPITMHLAPNEILLALDVQFRKDIKSQDLAQIIDGLERAIKRRFPEVKRIYVEARNLIGPAK